MYKDKKILWKFDLILVKFPTYLCLKKTIYSESAKLVILKTEAAIAPPKIGPTIYIHISFQFPANMLCEIPTAGLKAPPEIPPTAPQGFRMAKFL